MVDMENEKVKLQRIQGVLEGAKPPLINNLPPSLLEAV